MKKIIILAACVFLLLAPASASRRFTSTFLSTAVSVAASATATNGTEFTSVEIALPVDYGGNAGLIFLTFTRAAGSASLTVDFYFQVSYDGGTTWADFVEPISFVEPFTVITGHAVFSGTTVRVARPVMLSGASNIRLSKIINNDTANNLTACNATLSW